MKGERVSGGFAGPFRCNQSGAVQSGESFVNDSPVDRLFLIFGELLGEGCLLDADQSIRARVFFQYQIEDDRGSVPSNPDELASFTSRQHLEPGLLLVLGVHSFYLSRLIAFS